MTASLRLLLIEDVEDDALLIVRQLQAAGYDPIYERVDTAAAVSAALDRGPWDIVISDYNMPRFTGTAALQLLRARDPDTPLIFVSGTMGEDVAVEAMRAGAQDYVTKGNLGRLVPAIERELRDAVVRRERRAAEADRDRAEADLHASEARLKAIIDAALDAVITMDSDGVIRSWSTQAERVFGWPTSEVIGRNLAATIIPLRHREAHQRGLAHFLQSGEGPVLNQRIEITGLRRDGQEFPVELTITPVRLGGVWLFSAFVRDISERRLTEQRRTAQYALTRILAEATTLDRASTGILRAIAESLDWQAGVLWILEPQNDALRCRQIWHPANVDFGEFDRVTRATTLARGMGLPGRVWATDGPIWHRDVSTLESAQFPRVPYAIGAGVRSAFAFPIRSAAATTGVVEFFSRELREPDPDLLEMTAALGSQLGQFIERKRAEEALARSQATYRSLVEDSSFGIFQSALDGRLIAANPGLVSMLGYESEGELLRTNLGTDVYVDPGQRARLIQAVLKAGTLAAESQWRRKDGKTITVRQTGRVVRDAQGRVEYFNAIVEDVTERQLLEAQLRQAQKMESVGRLAGGVAHDFNNVLTAIFGYADLVLEDLPLGSAARQDIEEIRKAAERAAALTRQLLAFSRQQVLAPVVLSVNDLVEDIAKMLLRLVGEDIAVRLALARDAGNVRADPGQLQQVLMNLVVNARDAMPTGGKLLIETANAALTEQYAELHQPVVPGAYVMLAVSDTGIGMDAETKARIFEPFFTTKEKGRGTGLGLSTVYGIVKQSGGYIWVYSEPGRGTTFKLYFPRVVEPAEALPPPKETATLSGTETILLAEDDEMLRPLSKGLLEKLGYRVLEAENVERALAVASAYAGPIHLLVSDVVMPGASGRELARRLAPTRPDTRVLFVSGYTDDAVVHHGMLEPGLTFLQKPFTPAALARKVREVLDAT